MGLFDEELNKSKKDRDASISRREKRQRYTIPPKVYEGRAEDGRSIVRAIGGATVPAYDIGNIQAERGAIGKGDGRSYDPGTVMRRGERRRVTKKADVKVFYRDSSASPVTYWVGGDRQTPEQIPWTLPVGETLVSSPAFWVTGSELQDWGFTIKTRIGNQQVGSIFKIYTIYGDGRSFVASDPKLWTTLHYGSGVWLYNQLRLSTGWNYAYTPDRVTQVGINQATWNVGGNSNVEVCVSGLFASSSSCSPVPEGVFQSTVNGSNTWIRETISESNDLTFTRNTNTDPIFNFPFTWNVNSYSKNHVDKIWTTIPFTEANHSSWGTGTCPPGSPTIFRAWVNHGGSYTRLEELEQRTSQRFDSFSVSQKDGVVRDDKVELSLG